MDFVALDFETANSSRGSVCSIGLVEYEKGKLKREYYRLVKPKQNYFASINVSIHGITKEDVADAPEFDVLWEREIRELLEGKFLVAHNAQFDMSVLRAVLDQYNLPYPMLAYNCSVNISKKTWTLPRYKLNVVSDYLGIELEHHHALDDARASAQILLKAAEKLEANNVKELVEKTNTMNGMMFDTSYEPAKLNNKRRAKKQSESYVAATSEVITTHLFYQSQVVFTGKLEAMKREEAVQRIVDRGGNCQRNVEASTNYLVVGNATFQNYKIGKTNSQLERTEMLLAEGHAIEIISESDFLKLL
ncbi:exonuclease domain-containing protein [Guptibacillus hwajinpoensis]|uniref:DNA polymerase-3 subunit epsilon n=1 Tax=Guptibacillus hwajinpoensis TaxID=208199 RepID=A0ABU0K678_9BACL|nr:exonuclease domain-containing protein [Alkalihalobacillus hemicentroti]MDQ0483627.1 DNA polymerase-3 subunit epsilon [Alkalihalobacillus hemicentroti]